MDNKRLELATEIEEHITEMHQLFEYSQRTSEKNAWVEVTAPVPHQFPLNARQGYPLFPVSISWFMDQLNKIGRYNSAFGYTVGQHVASGYEFIANLTQEQRATAFKSDVDFALTALGFLLHDMEEAMIGDIISPVEKALGLNLKPFKAFIRARCLNRILLHGPPFNMPLLHHLILGWAMFFPYTGAYEAYSGSNLDVCRTIKRFAAHELSTSDLEKFNKFVQSTEGITPESVSGNIDTVDYLCFFSEAKYYNLVGDEAWGCATPFKQLPGVSDLPVLAEYYLRFSLWERSVEDLFNCMGDDDE